MTKFSKATRAGFGALMFVAALGVAGCEEEGAAEKAGKALDQTAKDAKKAVDDATK